MKYPIRDNLQYRQFSYNYLNFLNKSNKIQFSQITCPLQQMSNKTHSNPRLQQEKMSTNSSQVMAQKPLIQYSISPETQLSNFKQNSYRIIVCLLFGFINFINGMSWVVVSPITKQIQQAYGESSAVVALIPMSYMICYIFLNFPSNWVLDVKGIKKGVITGSVLTAIGTGIRCLVNYSFLYLIIGQFFCAIAQPFILNAPTKIATRWFTPENRSFALAILSVINIVGTATGFVIPTIFVETEGDKSDKMSQTVRDQFWMLLLFEFCLAIGATLLNLFFFAQRPVNLPSLSAMVQHTEFTASIKILFTSRKFLALAFAFATVNGAFNIYGSLLQQILHPYNITSDQTAVLAASMMVIGIISAAVVGIYVEKTLNYKRVFLVLSFLGIVQTIAFSVILDIEPSFLILLIIIVVQGVLFIPIMPLCFDYGCDIMFPVGEAQITGTLMTAGQIFGILFIVVSQQVFGLGKEEVEQKNAAFNTTVFVGCFLLCGCAGFCFFNSQLKRSKLESVQKQNNKPDSLISGHEV